MRLRKEAEIRATFRPWFSHLDYEQLVKIVMAVDARLPKLLRIAFSLAKGYWGAMKVLQPNLP